jgi:ATP-dependent Zn protease
MTILGSMKQEDKAVRTAHVMSRCPGRRGDYLSRNANIAAVTRVRVSGVALFASRFRGVQRRVMPGPSRMSACNGQSGPSGK